MLDLFNQLSDQDFREFAALIKNGLKVTTISPELKVKLADFVMWLEWHYGIDGHQDIEDLPLFKGKICTTS